MHYFTLGKMGDSQSTADTLDTFEHNDLVVSKLDLSHLPPVYVLAAHLSINEQHEAEDALSSAGAPLTYDIKEANIVLGNISKVRRAKSELHWKGVQTEELKPEQRVLRQSSVSSTESDASTPAKKRRKLASQSADVVNVNPSDGSETEDDAPDAGPMSQLSLSRASPSPSTDSSDTLEAEEISTPAIDAISLIGLVKVVKLNWLNDSLAAGKVLDLGDYLVYEARLSSNGKVSNGLSFALNSGLDIYVNKTVLEGWSDQRSILERWKADPVPNTSGHKRNDPAAEHNTNRTFTSSTQSRNNRSSRQVTRPSKLLHQTTSEHDDSTNTSLPTMPDWVIENKIYACERSTPLDPPNKDFICQLKKIKLARLLTLDEIGVRAYSSSIASIAAYPHKLCISREVLALPGCDQKIAHLFHEWQTTGQIQAIADLEADADLKVLREFYEIWGVGAKTAREFLYDEGWRDLDDIVDYGWKSLSRVQQIGVKYYDEFLLKIPRSEVEAITAIIHRHAQFVTDANVESIIVGGYRRGKTESGDVDVILSHRSESMTQNLVDRVVKSLEKEGWITHTLSLNLTNTKRNQEPLPINTATQVGHGFDTLDKALVVWQDPNWSTKEKDLTANPKAKDPNPHRRVDIIISPWRTVGCAIAGWTSGTTFQRDLRRYAKHVKGWKFDSSGVRERGTGRWVDLERWTDPKTRCRDWQEAEKRVFEGMGLVYREPWDRCTG